MNNTSINEVNLKKINDYIDYNIELTLDILNNFKNIKNTVNQLTIEKSDNNSMILDLYNNNENTSRVNYNKYFNPFDVYDYNINNNYKSYDDMIVNDTVSISTHSTITDNLFKNNVLNSPSTINENPFKGGSVLDEKFSDNDINENKKINKKKFFNKIFKK